MAGFQTAGNGGSERRSSNRRRYLACLEVKEEFNGRFGSDSRLAAKMTREQVNAATGAPAITDATILATIRRLRFVRALIQVRLAAAGSDVFTEQMAFVVGAKSIKKYRTALRAEATSLSPRSRYSS